MKNGSNEILEAKVAERNERAKKLYRYISDLARRVGEMTSSCKSVIDLFSMHIEIQRQKLRDNCEKLVFLDPLNYGKKTLELLWRKVYYDTVCTAKKLQEIDIENNNNLFMHIVCGIGHFHHFISKIQTDMKVTIKELDYISVYDDEECPEDDEPITEEEIQFGKSAMHSCLIYLGDLSRYQAEIFHNYDSSIAARYYLQAAHIDMSSGMPYNQLGNLYLDKNYNLDSVCYYIHCLNCPTPFEGAMDNLKKIFEKSDQFYETIHDTDTLTQVEHIQNTIVNFLSLIEIWYMSKNDTNIPQRCSTIAQGLKISMEFNKAPLPDIETVKYDEYLQAIEDENVTPSYLNANLMHKIVLICLFTIPKMMESDETKAFACKAFTLALYSQLLQKLLQQLNSIGLKNPASKYRERSTSLHEIEVDKATETSDLKEPEENCNNIISNGSNLAEDDNIKETDVKENDKITNGDTKNNKKNLKRRRRRRVMSSGSSDLSDVDSESDIETYESCSAEEDESDSTYQSDDNTNSIHSADETDGDEETEKCNGNHQDESKVNENTNKNIVNGNPPTVEEDKNSENILTEQTQEINEAELKKFLLGDNILASMKLLQDWILNEKDLILSCGESGDSLFQCVVDLLNILSFYFTHKIDKDIENECSILMHARSIVKKVKLEYKNTPLPEDINLRGTNICKFDKDAAEWQTLDHKNISINEENVIRVLNFIDFGNQIAKIVPRIRFNRTMKIFYLKRTTPPKHINKVNKRTREWHNSNKKQHIEQPDGGLLQKLGRLWLVSQVRELERSGRQTSSPALLALDTAVMHKHLRRVKQLLRTKNFILLIPAVVLQELDTLKREQSAARDAIRWLELQLKSGSRFLRAQRPGQSRPLPLIKYPRKAPPHIHNFIQILEFCNHFIGEDKTVSGGNGDAENSHTKSTPILVLLMGEQPGTEEERYKEFSVTGAAKSAGISMEYIEDFYAKWRQPVHKSGKKR